MDLMSTIESLNGRVNELSDKVKELEENQLLNMQIQLEVAEERRQAELLQLGVSLETVELILGEV